MSSQAKKIRVAVLYGGRSSEHEVSLLSASNVIQNLDKDRYEIVPIGIDKQGAWYLGDDLIRQKLEKEGRLELSQDVKNQLLTPHLIGNQVVSSKNNHLDVSGRLFDVVFPVIHGPLCEDGSIQGLLELADVPYVGCGVLASAVGMDKDIAKRLVMGAGLPVAPYLSVKIGHWKKNPAHYCDLAEKNLGFPVFVKPANTGSSVGVHKVKTKAELSAAIDDAFLYDTKILIERGIDAIELEVAVLESLESGSDPLVSVVGEIRPQHGHEFYSYEAKYIDEDGAKVIIPAPTSAEVQAEAQIIAKAIFETLECEGMARVDLFLERGTNKIFFNEINSIPGFTQISMYPKLLGATGVAYSDLLTQLVELAISRHERKMELHRDYSTV